MEDEKKIQAIKARLNEETSSKAWDDVIGIFTIPVLERNISGGYNVTLDKGLTAKAFVNTDTGEFRFFAFKEVQKMVKIKKPS